MTKGKIILLVILGVVLLAALAVGGMYNSLVSGEETVKTAWSQVENVYQRRLDLVPNLVETVKGYAAHEKSTFEEVTQARSRASGPVSPDVLSDPAKFQQFQESQAALGGALGRLLVVVEQYPELKANENFLSLQAQLEGTENRITVERGRFNETARAFNLLIRRFPSNLVALLFGFRSKEYFQADAGAQAAPRVAF